MIVVITKLKRSKEEILDCEKTMRGLKEIDAPVLKGCQIFHNYIRPHISLDGQTPADKCGIKIEGNNKWVTIIQNASKKKTFVLKCRFVLFIFSKLSDLNTITVLLIIFGIFGHDFKEKCVVLLRISLLEQKK